MNAGVASEFRRLKQHFEAEAARYPELTLSVHILASGLPLEKARFRRPNHAISLWQYMGNITPNTDIDKFAAFSHTRFGVKGAQISAFGVIEGKDTKNFIRMANRAGSLLSAPLIHQIQLLVMGNVGASELPGKPVFVCNPNPLAAWLNLVLVCIANYQPGRIQDRTLAVDPFTASLAAFDYVLDNSAVIGDTVSASPLAQKRFRVALSFPGEKREYVAKIADILQREIGDVFYDYYFEAELARPNLDILLQKIYHDNSDLLVVFLCEDYERKEWCGLEWRAVRDLIKTRRDAEVMPMRFDDAQVSGLFSIDGYVDLRRRSPEQAAELIMKRLSNMGHSDATKPDARAGKPPQPVAETPADDLSFIIITNHLGEQARWEVSHDTVKDDPVCPKCLVPMKHSSHSLPENNSFPGPIRRQLWVCPRDGARFEWDVPQYGFVNEWAADEFNARLRRSGMPPSVQPHATL